MGSDAATPNPLEVARRLARLNRLGVPDDFAASLAARQRPRFHNALPLLFVLGGIAAAVAGLALWASFLRSQAERDATAVGALLYDSDFGPGELATIFAALLLSGWLFAELVRKLGGEAARDRWAHDMMQEPARNKTAVNLMWRFMIARHGRRARDADAFLDQLASGLARDLGLALVLLAALSGVLWTTWPSHIALATRTEIAEQPVTTLLGTRKSHALSSAVSLTTGCAEISKEGQTLGFTIDFADGATFDLGKWTATAAGPGSQLDALAAIEAALPAGATKKRWRDIIGRSQLQSSCLRQKALATGGDGMAKLIRLLNISAAERAALGL